MQAAHSTRITNIAEVRALYDADADGQTKYTCGAVRVMMGYMLAVML